jgi:hypothetical protein
MFQYQTAADRPLSAPCASRNRIFHGLTPRGKDEGENIRPRTDDGWNHDGFDAPLAAGILCAVIAYDRWRLTPQRE